MYPQYAAASKQKKQLAEPYGPASRYLFARSLAALTMLQYALWACTGARSRRCPVAIVVVRPVGRRRVHQVKLPVAVVEINGADKAVAVKAIVGDIDRVAVFNEMHLYNAIAHLPVDVACYVVPRSVAVIVNPMTAALGETERVEREINVGVRRIVDASVIDR